MSKAALSVLGLFDTSQQLMDAIPAVKARALGRLEAYSPYPIHGIDKALGLRKSPVGGMVFVLGLIGAISAIVFELWAEGIDYPVLTGGKPLFSWQAFIPIMFEVTVLFACFTSGLGMLLLLNRLPAFRHPMLRSKSMPLITRDKFALAVEADAEALDVDAVSSALRDAGANSIEVIERPEPLGLLSPNFLMRESRSGLLAGHDGPVTPFHSGGRAAGLYFRFHQFWRYFAAGRAAIFHAGGGNIYTGHVFLQLASGCASVSHTTAFYSSFFDPV